jgi:protein-S-isoprenylcysteine O-methyltransferase Ste14
MKSNLMTLVVAIVMIALLGLYLPEVTWTGAKIVGGVIVAICFPLFVLARWQLGSSFSVEAKARALVTTGLYSRIRNPIYLFGGLVTMGVSLFFSVWGPLVVAALIVPLQVYRSRKEEQVLASAFGEEYRRYRSKTWF